MRATRAVLHSSKRPRASQQPRKQTTGDKDIPEIPGVDEKLVETIIHTTLDRSGAVAWTDISGLEHAKKCIRETIIWPMLRPDIFTGLRTPPRGLLLFGPPGTGKTLIGKAIASQCSATFFSISASTMVSKWAGEGEKTVRALFEVARHMQPSVVFIDEIDSLLCSRSEGEQEFTRRIKTEFLVQMDGVGCSGGDRVLVIGATNRPQELDEAARRRLTKRLYIPLPDTPARAMLVKVLMKRQENSLQEHDYGKIACMTAGYSGSDMYAVCAEAALGGVREVQGGIGDIDVGGVRGVEMKDFVDACRAVRASVGGSELGGYRDWNERFGSYPVMEEMEDAQGHGDGDANAMES